MTKELLTVDEVCALLKVKRSWIYNNPKLPHVKVGRYLRFYWSDVETYIAEMPANQLGINRTKNLVIRHPGLIGETAETRAQVERLQWFDLVVGGARNGNRT